MKISKSHSFDIDVAEKYGIKEALLINHFAFYISVNKRSKKNFHDGKTWVYHTIDELASYFPYMTKDEVRTTVDRLCNGKTRKSKGENEYQPILQKGNYNKTTFDHTTWYSFIEEGCLNSNNCYERAQAQIDLVESPNREGSSPNREWLEPSSIPSTKTSTELTTIETNVVVNFYSCLSKVDIPDSDKSCLMKFDEARVVMAIDWATHPLTKISKTLIQALIWYCKQEYPPTTPVTPREKEDSRLIEFEKNRELAKEVQKEFENITKENPNKYIVAGDSIITFRDTTRDIKSQIPYAEKDFSHKLLNEKRKFNLVKEK